MSKLIKIDKKKNKIKRLQILHKDEVSAIFGVPQFNLAEQNHFFGLPKNILEKLKINKKNGKNTSSKLYFILQYGYFQARHQFFSINYKDVKEDVLFIIKNYMPNDSIPHELPIRKTQAYLKNNILQFMGFNNDSDQTDQLILKKASDLAKITQKLPEIFDDIAKHLEYKKTVLPPYSRLQDLIGAALKLEEDRLIQLVNSHLTKRASKSIEKLFQHDEAFYQITALKFDAKSFKTAEMTEEIRKLTLCKPIYEFAKQFLPKLMLSRRMIDHYSDLAKLFTVDRLSQLPKELSYLYLICYVNGRCEQLTNNLIQGFMYYVDKYQDDGVKYAEKNMDKIKDPLEEARIPIGKLIGIFANDKIMKLDGEKIKKHALKLMSEEDIRLNSRLLQQREITRKKQERKLIWEYHKNNYQSLLINLRPLFLAIDFEGDEKLKDLFKAVKFLKSSIENKKPLKKIPFNSIPIAHIKPKSLIDYFTEKTGENNEEETDK
ncbi:MAG: DUF4158 domain-containing protein [Gammaproteobacteria bacterium]